MVGVPALADKVVKRRRDLKKAQSAQIDARKYGQRAFVYHEEGIMKKLSSLGALLASPGRDRPFVLGFATPTKAQGGSMLRRLPGVQP
jgi:hypothetical protein